MRRFAQFSNCQRIVATASGCIGSAAPILRNTSTTPSSAKTTGVVLGRTDRGVRTSDFSKTSMSDIAVSTHVLKIASTQIPAGDVLGAMDVCAGNVAQMHCTGSRRFGRDSKGHMGTSVCTVAVDQTPFLRPALNGDMVVVEGRAIHAGNSSIGVAVEVFRLQFPTRQKTPVCNSFFTMVAIDEHLKKVDVVPALELSCERDVRLNRQYLTGLALSRMSPQGRLQQVIRLTESTVKGGGGGSGANAAPTDSLIGGGGGDIADDGLSSRKYARMLAEAKSFNPSDIECLPNKQKSTKVTFEATRTEANRVFFPQFLNLNNTIFGGELMRWMEAHALQCGRMFSANKDVRSLGMYNVTFNDAVGVQDWVTLNAHVVYVHRTTMEVEVEIGVEREDKKVVTNRASFVLANFDEAGQLIDIPVGLDLSGASKEWMDRYADARARYEVGRLSRDRLQNAFDSGR